MIIKIKTTLLASEMLNRKSFGFEIKKEFVRNFNDKLSKNIQKELFCDFQSDTKEENNQSLLFNEI